jgi:hypothetical protein
MVNIQLNEGLAAALSAKAAARGMTLQAYLEATLLAAPLGRPTGISADELDRLLDQETTVGPSPSGTFSRTEIYDDHD